MKQLNLTPEIVALLTKEAHCYITPYTFSEVHDEVHKEKLVKEFIACFEPADSNSVAYEENNVCLKYLGWKLDRRHFLNEYWVDNEWRIFKVWGKNKASVRKYLKGVGHGYIREIVLARKFDKVAFINSITS